MADVAIRIGDLRWLVWLVSRDQIADPTGTGILEQIANARQVHAKIEALRPMTFYGARQVDEPITHMVTVRWLDYLDNAHAFIRQTRRPSDDATRTEVFRIRRIMEVGGRKRFSMCECELEGAGWLVPLPGGTVPSVLLPQIDENGNAETDPGLQP